MSSAAARADSDKPAADPNQDPLTADDRAVRTPTRLTAGASNQLMGVMSPREDALYFVSDRGGTLDLMVQRPIDTGPKRLFDGLGDVAWPEVSPDGKRIAYIAYTRDATGDACVRKLDGSDETCLTDNSSAELQVLWWDDSSLAVLSRDELHGDFALHQISVSKRGTDTVLAQNMVGLALSPDRRWLAYVPLVPQRKGVGVTFSNRTATGVHLRATGGGEPIVYSPPLPGATGFLAFGRDGSHLYFSQYLNDTNGDGVIDGGDNSVLFRVRFRSDAAAPIANQMPQQLTSARWNCHYPSPSTTKLIATCSHEGSLDVYELPLEGAVPRTWGLQRVSEELPFARDSWTQLLLMSRLLELETRPGERAHILQRMVPQHISLREYRSALFYCDQLEALGGEHTRWAVIMRELALHRRADLALIRGQVSARYIATETERSTRIAEAAAGGDPDIAALAELVTSEILDDIGDKGGAVARFAAVDLATVSDPAVLAVAADRAERIYGLLGDRDALIGVLRKLAGHDKLSVADRLVYSEQLIDELLRGVPRSDRAARLAGARSQTADDSELALLLDVERALARLDDSNEEEVRAEVFEMYRANKDLYRRRALVLTTVRAAAREGNEYLQYQFATSWASWLRHEHPERKYAEELFRRVVMDRAYGELGQGDIAEARGYFFATTKTTGSLEGHIGFVEARVREGTVSVMDEYAKRYAATPNDPTYLFVQAYWEARALPELTDAKRHDAGVDRIVKLLERVDRALPRRYEVHQVWGFALHQRARRTGSRDAAASANRHYLLALDLAHDNARARASLLLELGVLQASLGNHRLALEHFKVRDRLPYVRADSELVLRLATARSAFHINDVKRARDEGRRAIALIERHAELRKYALVAVDRLALYEWAAGDYPEAVERYRELVTLVDRAPVDGDGAPLNRVKARLGLAASAVGAGDGDAALAALAQVDELMAGDAPLRPEPKVLWERSLLHSYRYDTNQYDTVIAGLRAQGYRLRGDYAAAERAMQQRRDLIAARFERSGADEDLLELARCHYHLAELAYRNGRRGDARPLLETGLEYAATYNERTGSEVNEVGLALLRAYAELHLLGEVPLSEYRRDLVVELTDAYDFICRYPSPRWANQRFVFELYLTMLSVPSNQRGPDEHAYVSPGPVDDRAHLDRIGGL